MNPNDVNSILILGLITLACAGLILWLSPTGLQKASNRLAARSKALRASRNVYRAVHTQVMQETEGADNAERQTEQKDSDKRQTPPISLYNPRNTAIK